MASKNSSQQRNIEHRRKCVKDAWIALGVFGVTQHQIVERLKADYDISVDQSTVSRDLAIIKQRLIDQTTAELKSELWGAYMHVVNQAREGWRRSLEDKEVTVFENVQGAGGDGNDRIKAQERKEGQSGNASFLAEEQKAYKAMREMFGVDEAAKWEHSGPGGGPIPYAKIIMESPDTPEGISESMDGNE
jgi:hypothetical protein